MFLRRKRLLRQVEVVRFEPGDMIVFSADGPMSQDKAERVRHALRELFDTENVGVVSGGKLSVWREGAGNVQS